LPSPVGEGQYGSQFANKNNLFIFPTELY